MRRLVVGCALLVLLGPAARAGVVVQMEVSGSKSGGETETLYAQGEMARMDTRSPRKGESMSVLFRDQTMWFVNHEEKVAQKIDKEGMAALSAQLGAAMKQLESLPPAQREMMQKMMKGKMPGMGDEPERRLEKGGSDRVGEYACTVSTLYSDDRMVWEVCTAPQGSVAEMSEAMGAFRALSEFAQELQDAVKQGPFASMMDNPYSDLNELEGFPVRTRMFDRNGGVMRETVLKDVTEKTLGEEIFTVPDGYKVKDLKDELSRSR